VRDGKIADVGYHPPFDLLFSTSEFEYGDLVDLTSPGSGYRIELAARRGRPPARRETPASFKARRTVLAATRDSWAIQFADRPSA
jgi:hypothetical protein